MLTVPTAREIMADDYYIKCGPPDKWSERTRTAFIWDMKRIQEDLITLRHMANMDSETLQRAMMVIDGTYHGQAIRRVASV